MLVPAEWFRCDDGIVRPVLRAEVEAATGAWTAVEFLLDTGADQSVLAATTLWQLALPHGAASGILGGVGGGSPAVPVSTTIRLRSDAGTWAAFEGKIAAFTDPFALDMSVIGRDILDSFAVVFDRPGDCVALLAQGHTYHISG
jgi:hypothetical protein